MTYGDRSISQNVMLRAEQIRRMGDRHTGIGFDQLLIVEPGAGPTQNSAIGSSTRRQRGGALRQWCSLLCVIRQQKQLTRSNPIKVATMNGLLELKILPDQTVRVIWGNRG